MLQFSTLVLSLVLFSACAGNPLAEPREMEEAPVDFALEEELHYTTLLFERGATELGEMNKRELNELAQKVSRDDREIEEIKVLAWGDQEQAEEASSQDIRLASKRAKAVKSYIKEDLHANETVETFNMAKPPGPISRSLKNDEWEMKEAYQAAGATATRLPNGQVSYTKASKVLVVVDYQENDEKL